MLDTNLKVDKHKLLNITFILSSLYYIIYTLSFTFGSVYLSRFFSNDNISIIFLISFLFGFVFSVKLIKKINKEHTFKITSFLLSITFVSSIILGTNNLNNTNIILLFFPILIIGVILLLTIINLYIEDFADLRNTGSIRGINLVIVHAAIILGLILGTFTIIGNPNINHIFILSAIVHLPMFYFLHKYYKNLKDPVYKNTNLKNSVKKILGNKDIKRIFISALGLEGFFTIMNIFLPIYIINTIGLSILSYFAILMPMSMIPYIIIPFILNDNSIKHISYKSILLLGYFFIFIITAIIPFIDSKEILIWGIILLTSRIGASIVDTINNIYFYNKIHPDDIGSVNLFTNIKTIGYIIGTFIITITLFFTDKIEILFFLYLCFGVYILHEILQMKEDKIK